MRRNRPELKQYRKIDCKRCGAPKWSKQNECHTRRKKCVKRGKIEHYAKCCRSSRRMNHVAEEETYSAEDDDWTPDRIHSIHQKNHSLGTNRENGPPFYTATLLVNNRPIKFIIDTGIPVTLITKSEFNNTTMMNDR